MRAHAIDGKSFFSTSVFLAHRVRINHQNIRIYVYSKTFVEKNYSSSLAVIVYAAQCLPRACWRRIIILRNAKNTVFVRPKRGFHLGP